jgi:anti-sigma B factor antagonist
VAELEAKVRDRDAVSVVDLDGDIDAAAHGPLRAAWEEAARPGRGGIVLNFEAVRYIDSTGIALLVELLAGTRAERRTVAACGLIDHYRMIFEITRLSDFIGLHPDEDAAVAALAAVGGAAPGDDRG